MSKLADRMTRRLVGGETGSLAQRARARRFDLLMARFPALSQWRVLDLGGDPQSWRHAPVRPREVVLLNLDWQVAGYRDDLVPDASWMRAVPGDACAPSAEIASDHFDLVFSNSVIEHVGGHAQREAFATWARRLGDHYWVQTPNRYFPVEPHWLFPGFQFLPRRVAARAMLRWPLGNFADGDWTYEQAVRHVAGVELLSVRQLRGYFPDAALLRERWGVLTKSLVAVR